MLRRLVRSIPAPAKERLQLLAPDEVALVHRFVAEHADKGVMVDVGACRGSSLAPFARSGWTVLAFEPDSANRDELTAAWGSVGNVRIDERAVSDEPRVGIPFYRSDVSEGISGLSAFHPSHEEAGTVDVTTLSDVVAESGVEHIDVLKVDTEGHDLFVLRGLDWERTPPDVIVCEFEDAKTIPLGYRFDDMARYLAERNYTVIVSEWHPVVEYGQQHSWRSFSLYPTELADPDGWGNLIAVRDPDLAREVVDSLPAVSRRWRFGGPVKRFLLS